MTRPVRVATVITRLDGGAGVLALRGALALDRGQFQTALITGHVPGTGDRLLDQARQEGLEVITEPALRAPIDPRHDAAALRSLTDLMRHRSFDVVHTHTAKAGVLGRIAARRAAVPRVVQAVPVVVRARAGHQLTSCRAATTAWKPAIWVGERRASASPSRSETAARTRSATSWPASVSGSRNDRRSVASSSRVR